MVGSKGFQLQQPHNNTYILIFFPTYICLKVDELLVHFVVDHLERLPSMENLVGLHTLRFVVDVWRGGDVAQWKRVGLRTLRYLVRILSAPVSRTGDVKSGVLDYSL